jgi:hypothetical protein
VHDVDLVQEAVVDDLVDGRNAQVLVDHLLVVELEPHNPGVWLLFRVSKDWNLVVERHEVLIGFDDGLFRVRIVEDLGARDDVLEGGVLDEASELGDHLLSLPVLLLQEDLQRWSLDVLGDVDDLLHPGDTERHIFGGDASKVEGVQGHLGRRLSKALSSHTADHLARMDQALLKLGLDFSKNPVERASVELLVDDHVLRVQDRLDVDPQEHGGVRVGIDE